MSADENKLEILKKVENGTLSVEEGADLIGILERAEQVRRDTAAEEVIPPVEDLHPEKPVQTSGCWKAAWSMVLTGGGILTAFSAFWIYQQFQKHTFSRGFWLLWIPFILGLLLTIFGVVLLESPWMHVVIRSKSSEKLANFTISIPMPLGLASWVFRTFGDYMPQEVRDKGIDEMIDEVTKSINRDEPFQIDIDEEDDNSRVFIRFSRS